MAFRAAAGLLLASAMVRRAAADSSVPIAYCASINTASTSANSSIYQSDGLCHDFCIDSYAYAVVLEQECWCSDYTPDSSAQVDTSECDTPCPGYPSDLCGGPDLYGYMKLSKSASGTKGATSSAAAATSSAAPTTTSTTSTTTPSTSTTPTPTPTPTPSPSSSPSPTPTTTSTTPSTSSSSSSQPQPAIATSISTFKTTATAAAASPTVSTVTTGGIVQTVTVTPLSAAATSAVSSSRHKGLSTGASIGIAVGTVIGAVFMAGVAFFVWRRKRQQTEKDEALFAASTRGGSPGTSHGLGDGGGSTLGRRTANGSWDGTSGRRRSTLMQIDPRLDPAYSDIYARTDNKSRDSVNSLRDDHDYSRRVLQPPKVLRATNPDPEHA